MADDTRPQHAVTPSLTKFLEGVRAGMAGLDPETVDANLRSMRESLARLQGQVPGTPREQARDLEPAVVGGEEEKKPKRTRRGKVTTRGRHRVMNHWEIFDSELNELGGLQQDAIRYYGMAGFFVALSIDIFRDVFTSDMAMAEHAFWFAIAVGSAVLAVWSYLNGRYAKGRGATRLQQIKDEHDEE